LISPVSGLNAPSLAASSSSSPAEPVASSAAATDVDAFSEETVSAADFRTEEFFSACRARCEVSASTVVASVLTRVVSVDVLSTRLSTRERRTETIIALHRH